MFGPFGGFTQLKQEAREANQRAREQHGEAVPTAALVRIDELVAQLKRPLTVKPVPFGEALRAVLDGPHAQRQPPKQ
jgi:HPt (histidine-containing phosphotransfer) domain-containing protein